MAYIIFAQGFDKRKQFKDAKDGRAYFNIAEGSNTMNYLLTKVGRSQQFVTTMFEIPKQSTMTQQERKDVEDETKLLQEGMQPHFFAQRGVGNKVKVKDVEVTLPPHSYNGIDSLQVGSVKLQLEREWMVALVHYKALYDYLSSKASSDPEKWKSYVQSEAAFLQDL